MKIEAYRFSRTERGRPHAESDGEVDVTADFLNTDIGENLHFCEMVLLQIARVASGDIADYSTTGNLYQLSLTPSSATIANQFDDNVAAEWELRDFETLLRKWRDFFLAVA